MRRDVKNMTIENYRENVEMNGPLQGGVRVLHTFAPRTRWFCNFVEPELGMAQDHAGDPPPCCRRSRIRGCRCALGSRRADLQEHRRHRARLRKLRRLQ